MTNSNENAIREAAYFIWKNNGCPANTSQQDWNAAIAQLTMASAKKTSLASAKKGILASLSNKKSSACKSASACKKSTASKAKASKKAK